MDTADNRNYGLPRRGGTKGCSTAKDRTGTSFDNLTFYEGKRSRRKRDWPAKPSIPFPRPKSRGEGSPLFLLSSPSPCYKQSITTIEVLSAEYSYGCFIVFFSFISSNNLLSPLDNFAKSFLPRRKNISGAQTFAWTKFYYIE